MAVRRALSVVVVALATLLATSHGATALSGVGIGADGPFAPAARTRNPLSIIPIGCVANLSAATLDAWLRDRLGPLRGDRTLWLLSDPYVDLSQVNNGPLDPSDYVHNTLMVQDGQCFSLVQRVAGGLPWEFAPSRSPGDWYWPLGGSIGDGGLLYVFWSR